MIFLFNDVKELTGTVRNNHILNLLYEREKNGIYSVSAEIPVTYNDQGTIYNYNKKVQKSDFLGHYDKEGRFQLHKIAAVDIENGSIFVKGIHIFFDEAKAGAIIQDRRFINREIIDGARVAFESIGWSVADFDVSVGKTYNFYNVTPLEVRQILVETFGFEFDYWLDFDGKKVTNRHVAVKEKIGEKTNKRYTYGHNVLNIRAEQDYSEIYTAVIGRGKGEEIEETGGYGRRIEYTDVVWSTPSKPLNKPAGTRVLEDPNATQLFGYKENGVVKPRVKVEVFSDIESPTELIQASYEWLMDNNVPKAVFSLKVADGDGLNLGDEVYVIYRDIDLIKSARVEKVTDDLVSGNRDVEFGDTAYFDTDRRMSGLRSDLKRHSGETGDKIYRLKMEFNRRFDEEVSAWVAEYEQALIDAHAQIEADRENMTNLIEGTRSEFMVNINAEITQTKEYAEQQAQAKAGAVGDKLDAFSERQEALLSGIGTDVAELKISNGNIQAAVSDANGLASTIALSPTAINLISDKIDVTGNANIKGGVTALAVDAVEGNFARLFANQLTADVITSDHIQVGIALVDKMFATSARIDRLITKTHFSDNIKTLSIDAVHADLRSVNSEIMTTNILKSDWIDVDNAIVNRIISRQFFTDNAVIKSANIIDLTAIDIKGGILSALNGSYTQNLNTGITDYYGNALIHFHDENNRLRMTHQGHIMEIGTKRGTTSPIFYMGGHRNLTGQVEPNDYGFTGLKTISDINRADVIGDRVYIAEGGQQNAMAVSFDYSTALSNRTGYMMPIRRDSSDSYYIGDMNTWFDGVYTHRLSGLDIYRNPTSHNVDIGRSLSSYPTSAPRWSFRSDDIWYRDGGGSISVKERLAYAKSAYDRVFVGNNSVDEQIRSLAGRIHALERR